MSCFAFLSRYTHTCYLISRSSLFSPTLKRPPGLIPLLAPGQTYVHPTCNTTRHYDRNTITLVYFTGSWCGPCRRFTPALQKFYEAANREGREGVAVEILFVPCEVQLDPASNAAAAKEYYDGHVMKFLTLPFDQRLVTDSWDSLKQTFGVYAGPRDHGALKGVERNSGGIPTLVLVNAKGDAVDFNARGQVEVALERGDVDGLVKEWRDRCEGSL